MGPYFRAWWGLVTQTDIEDCDDKAASYRSDVGRGEFILTVPIRK